jgi:hypothetical protein
MGASESFASISAKVPMVVQSTVAGVVAAVKANYADSYPASLFKNLGKCRLLAKMVVGT